MSLATAGVGHGVLAYPRAVTTNHTPGTGADSRGPAILIRPETGDDHQAVGKLHLAAFPDDEIVADLVDALRAARAPSAPMSFVATIGHQTVGHVLLSASRLDAPRRIVDILVLAPLGVLPGFQNQGIGTRLIEHALAAADSQGAPLVFLEGSPDYYGKRGFGRADEVGFRSPSLRIPAPAFQVARLSAYEPWMTGTLVYSETFWALDCVGLRDPEPAAPVSSPPGR
jgi:putative acetyltransferase